MVLNPVFLRSTNLEIHADRLVLILNLLADSQFWESSIVHCPYTWNLPSFLSALASNNAFIFKLVKMWLGGALMHVVVGTLKISLDRHFLEHNHTPSG